MTTLHLQVTGALLREVHEFVDLATLVYGPVDYDDPYDIYDNYDYVSDAGAAPGIPLGNDEESEAPEMQIAGAEADEGSPSTNLSSSCVDGENGCTTEGDEGAPPEHKEKEDNEDDDEDEEGKEGGEGEGERERDPRSLLTQAPPTNLDTKSRRLAQSSGQGSGSDSWNVNLAHKLTAHFGDQLANPKKYSMGRHVTQLPAVAEDEEAEEAAGAFVSKPPPPPPPRPSPVKHGEEQVTGVRAGGSRYPDEVTVCRDSSMLLEDQITYDSEP